MDKRYLLIIIIIIICCINLAFIVNSSSVVGSASVSAGNYLFSAPQGFSLYEDTSWNSAVIKNSDGVRIYFEVNSTNDNYNKKLNYLENKSDDKILSQGNLNIDNITVNTIFYQTKNNTNYSAFYFELDNIPFKIVISNFDYSDRETIIDYVTSIIQSTHLDYKTTM